MKLALPLLTSVCLLAACSTQGENPSLPPIGDPSFSSSSSDDISSRVSALEDTVSSLKSEYDAIDDSVKPFDEWRWESKYEDSDQYNKDCAAWLKKHPHDADKIKDTDPYDDYADSNGMACPNGEMTDGSGNTLCEYDMNKKDPVGEIIQIQCYKPYVPSVKPAPDFIP